MEDSIIIIIILIGIFAIGPLIALYDKITDYFYHKKQAKEQEKRKIEQNIIEKQKEEERKQKEEERKRNEVEKRKTLC